MSTFYSFRYKKFWYDFIKISSKPQQKKNCSLKYRLEDEVLK